jgi:predicted glutamine amidotransferase
MLCFTAPDAQTLPPAHLRAFVRACRWGNPRVQDFLGHHGFGWGLVWRDRRGRFRVHRSVRALWEDPWEAIGRLRTTCLALHARFCFPWKRNIEDVHPIAVENGPLLMHNGQFVNKSFGPLRAEDLDRLRRTTDMDTRKYYCALVDEMRRGATPKAAFEKVLPAVQVIDSANAFLVTEEALHVVEWHQASVLQQYLYDLTFCHDEARGHTVISSTPLGSGFRRIPNHSILTYEFERGQWTAEQLAKK